MSSAKGAKRKPKPPQTGVHGGETDALRDEPPPQSHAMEQAPATTTTTTTTTSTAPAIANEAPEDAELSELVDGAVNDADDNGSDDGSDDDSAKSLCLLRVSLEATGIASRYKLNTAFLQPDTKWLLDGTNVEESDGGELYLVVHEGGEATVVGRDGQLFSLHTPIEDSVRETAQARLCTVANLGYERQMQLLAIIETHGELAQLTAETRSFANSDAIRQLMLSRKNEDMAVLARCITLVGTLRQTLIEMVITHGRAQEARAVFTVRQPIRSSDLAHIVSGSVDCLFLLHALSSGVGGSGDARACPGALARASPVPLRRTKTDVHVVLPLSSPGSSDADVLVLNGEASLSQGFVSGMEAHVAVYQTASAERFRVKAIDGGCRVKLVSRMSQPQAVAAASRGLYTPQPRRADGTATRDECVDVNLLCVLWKSIVPMIATMVHAYDAEAGFAQLRKAVVVLVEADVVTTPYTRLEGCLKGANSALSGLQKVLARVAPV